MKSQSRWASTPSPLRWRGVEEGMVEVAGVEVEVEVVAVAARQSPAADAAADERREEGGGAAGPQPLPAHFGVEKEAAVRRDELRRCRGRSERR